MLVKVCVNFLPSSLDRNYEAMLLLLIYVPVKLMGQC